jgi:hypothetical protein
MRLQQHTDFLANVYFNDQLMVNQYLLQVDLLSNHHDPEHVTNALHRMTAFLNVELNDAIFIHQDQVDQIDLLQELNANIVTVPEDPVDQVVGLALFHKLNAIMEDRVRVTEIRIQSKVGDNIWFMIDEDMEIDTFDDSTAWWHQSSTCHNCCDVLPESSNVAALPVSGWGDYALDWPGQETAEHTSVVPFHKNEN